MISNYIPLFGESTKEFSSPMEEKDHSELDLSPELDLNGVGVYLFLIGALQLAVAIGRSSSWVLLPCQAFVLHLLKRPLPPQTHLWIP
jgi:hypothetical protein